MITFFIGLATGAVIGLATGFMIGVLVAVVMSVDGGTDDD